MNLKTHTAYPESFFDKDSGKWTLEFLNVSGEVMFKDSTDAKKQIARLIDENAPDFKKED